MGGGFQDRPIVTFEAVPNDSFWTLGVYARLGTSIPRERVLAPTGDSPSMAVEWPTRHVYADLRVIDGRSRSTDFGTVFLVGSPHPPYCTGHGSGDADDRLFFVDALLQKILVLNFEGVVILGADGSSCRAHHDGLEFSIIGLVSALACRLGP